jgi:hypothetical protein
MTKRMKKDAEDGRMESEFLGRTLWSWIVGLACWGLIIWPLGAANVGAGRGFLVVLGAMCSSLLSYREGLND